MRSVFFYTLAISVALVFSQQPFVRYPEYLRKAVPPHYNNDQKTADRGVDKNARRHKVEPRQPPLRPHPEVPWLRWVQEGRWAAQVDKNTEQHRVRARLLEEKLKPNQFVFKPRINPQLKPKVNHQNGNVRMKREAKKPQLETVHKEKEAEENVRHKRDATIFELEPEEAKQPQVDQADRKYGDRIQQPVRRDKRQILYLIDRPQQLLYRGVKTTPNPFIRDTHVDDYDIIRPEVGEREGMIPTVESDSSDPDSYPLVKIPQALFRFIQIAKIKIEQSFLAKTDRPNDRTEESHIRVKRRMSRFVRDRKQITRKKKIGRAKKTKVKRAPIKVRRWYHKRQNKKKVGDGTYRGGRGRKPRQHKRPRHYKPPMNETSDYDYYDSNGNIRGEENPEGPNVADYLSYVSGEYSDTVEAQRAHQEMEKEYQDQLKRERLREKQRKLMNGTVESHEEISYEPYRGPKSKVDSKVKGKEYEKKVKERKENKIKEKTEKNKKANKFESTEESKENESKIKTNYGKGKGKIKKKSDESTEESTEEITEESSSEESEEGSTEEDTSESQVEGSTEEESSDEGSSGDSSGGEKQRKFPRKFRKSPRWKQGKTGKYESDPRKVQNKQGLNNKSDKHPKDFNHAISLEENINPGNQQKPASKSQASANVRKAARKFNFFSLSSYPIIRNFMSVGESHPENVQRRYMQPNDHPSNRISSLRFETPDHTAIQRLHSMPLKPAPDAVSLTNPNLVSKGGENLKNLQSRLVETPLQSTFKDRGLTSIAQEKPKDTPTLVSKTKDERKKWTSIGTDSMRNIQSLKVDPVVLTSIAKTVPELNIAEHELEKVLMKCHTNLDKVTTGTGFVDRRKKRTRLQGLADLTAIAKNIPPLHSDSKEKKRNYENKGSNKLQHIEANVMDRNEKENVHSNQPQVSDMSKKIFKSKHYIVETGDEIKISKREVEDKNLANDSIMSYEELSTIPDSAGVSIKSDEIESASDDK